MEIAELGRYKCSQSECSIEMTGKCVNGLNPKDCSNKLDILIDKIVVEAEDVSNISSSSREVVRLPWGDSFSEDEVSYITYRYSCKLILLLGEPSSGKSTLYAALFDSFHKGGCGEFFFASTKTPIGFERICHYAREKCRGKHSNTERTKSHEFTYLHLSVRDKNLKQDAQHLIFADVNGERFQAAKDNDADMIKLSALKRADHVFFIADGGLLLHNAEKHVVKSDVHKLISRCIQNSMLNKDQSVTLIITKWDEINAAGKEKDVTDFFIEPTLIRYKENIKSVIRLASRSINSEVPPRTGIDEFLNICLTKPKAAKEQHFLLPLNREFQKFKYKETL